MLRFVTTITVLLTFSMASAAIDCSEAYGKNTRCEIVGCNSRFQSFLGEWKGPFEAYDRKLSSQKEIVYRPYNNTITYSEKDCLRNIENGDQFIIGRKLDEYPAFRGLEAKTSVGIMITGQRADGSAFLRTIDAENGIVDYSLEYKNSVANLSVWSFQIPASKETPSTFLTIFDAQDSNYHLSDKRNVTVTMTVGPKENPIWSGIVVRGFHILHK